MCLQEQGAGVVMVIDDGVTDEGGLYNATAATCRLHPAPKNAVENAVGSWQHALPHETLIRLQFGEYLYSINVLILAEMSSVQDFAHLPTPNRPQTPKSPHNIVTMAMVDMNRPTVRLYY